MNARLPIAISTAPWLSLEFWVFMWSSCLSGGSRYSREISNEAEPCRHREGLRVLRTVSARSLGAILLCAVDDQLRDRPPERCGHVGVDGRGSLQRHHAPSLESTRMR